jgi:hypothetical protein
MGLVNPGGACGAGAGSSAVDALRHHDAVVGLQDRLNLSLQRLLLSLQRLLVRRGGDSLLRRRQSGRALDGPHLDGARRVVEGRPLRIGRR